MIGLTNEIREAALRVSQMRLSKRATDKESSEIDEWYYKGSFGIFGCLVKNFGHAIKTTLRLDEYNEIDESILR